VGAKIVQTEGKTKFYLSFSEVQPIFETAGSLKVTIKRGIFQIYLRKSEREYLRAKAQNYEKFESRTKEFILFYAKMK